MLKMYPVSVPLSQTVIQSDFIKEDKNWTQYTAYELRKPVIIKHTNYNKG